MPKDLKPMPARVRKSMGQEIGLESGIAMDGIIVNSDYNNKLTGTASVEIYDQMRKGDATVKAVSEAIKLPILSARWRVDPANESRKDTQIAQFVQEELFDKGTRTWQETLEIILLFLDYGRMPMELVYEFREDQMIGLRKISPRPPETIYKWQLKNGDPGILQNVLGKEYEIPMEKLVIFVKNKEGGNWEGISIYRSAYKHWYMKEKLYLIDALSAERQGLGVPYAKVQAGATEQDKSKLQEILSNMRANQKGYALFEDGMEVGFLDMKAGTAKNLMPSIQHHDRQIAKNVLAQFIDLGIGNGSYALSQDQSKLFILSLESIANYIKDAVNKYVIKKLVDFNFDVEEYPELNFDKIGTVDHNALTTSLQRLSQIGALTLTKTDEVYLRDIMDLPDNDGKDEIDLAMFDDIFAELDAEMGELTGESATEDAVEEDPNNPGFDMEGNPMEMPTDMQQASWTNDQWRFAADKMKIKIGGKPGVPLSEETKRKISEALSKGKGKGKGGKGKGKGQSPEVAKKQKEIKDLQAKIRKFNADTKIKLLEMKAKGEKLSPEDQAKMTLEIFKQKTDLSEKVAKLKDEVTEIKSKTKAPEKTASVLDKIGDLLDGLEK